jgi:ABC-type transport system substrate-binding protein
VRALAVASLLVLAAPAHAETRPRYGGSVEATLLGAPATLDPLTARTHAEVTVVELLFDTLYRPRADGSVEPELADGPPVLDEKKTTVRIAIKRGIKLHDGTELGALDVAQTLERARLQARWLVPGLIGVKTDGDAVVLSLRAPQPELPIVLALPQLAITKAGKPPGDRPIGTGPYATGGPDRARRKLQLRAFDEHFGGRPYLDQLVLTWYDTPDAEARRFETGKAQVSARGAAAFAGGRPAFKSLDVEGPAALLLFVGFGRAHADLTADRAFRKALDLALGRGGLTSISSGERVIPTRSPVPVEAGGTALAAASRAGDVDAARRQLAEAAKRVPSLRQLAKLRLEVLIEDTRPDDREIAERVVLALDKLGIQAVITAVPATTLRDRVAKGQCDLWIGQLAEPIGAQPVWWSAAFAAGNDDWAASQVSLDPAVAAREFAQRLPIVPLMFRSVRMWHPTNLHGVAFDASGRPLYADLYLFGAQIPFRSRQPANGGRP